MGKKDRIRKTEKIRSEDFEAFYDELRRETERGLAVVSAAHLDESLRRCLENYLIDEPEKARQLLENESGAALSAFSSRTLAAYCLGIISEPEYEALGIVRQVRNRFAHRLTGLSFSDPEIADRCSRFREYVGADGKPIDRETPRELFTVAVVELHFALRFRETMSDRRKSAPPWTFLHKSSK